jgi:hypothetical protein
MFTRENWTTLVSAASRNPRAQRAPSDGLRMNRSRAEPPGVFRATSAMLPTLPGSIASARAPDPGTSRRCLSVWSRSRGRGHIRDCADSVPIDHARAQLAWRIHQDAIIDE